MTVIQYFFRANRPIIQVLAKVANHLAKLLEIKLLGIKTLPGVGLCCCIPMGMRDLQMVSCGHGPGDNISHFYNVPRS